MHRHGIALFWQVVEHVVGVIVNSGHEQLYAGVVERVGDVAIVAVRQHVHKARVGRDDGEACVTGVVYNVNVRYGVFTRYGGRARDRLIEK